MATIKPNIADLARNTEATADVGKIAVPHTAVANRAEIFDLSKIPAPKMGIERVRLKSITRMVGETVSDGEDVYSVKEDPYDRVRLYGNISTFASASGSGIGLNSTDDTIEITFYGTGLNLLVVPETSRDFFATVDGNAEDPTDLFPSMNSVIRTRNYDPNVAIPIVSGLAEGLHTVKVRNSGGGSAVQGFEIVNESATLSIPTGNVSGEIIPAGSVAFDSGFDLEEGTSGTKGGRVVVYSEGNQTKKAIRYVDATQGNLGSADHSNEEVIARYHWRRFGANRADDFSTATGGGFDKAYTLKDGITSLHCNDANENEFENWLSMDSGSSFIKLTFVGTGLAVTRKEDAGAAGTTAWPVSINGASIGNIGDLDGSGGIQDREAVQQIVSGLPYGTHTVTFGKGATAYNIAFQEFIIYGPKKPTIPEGATELASYNLMADFVVDTTVSPDSISQGVIAKNCSREHVYEGSAALGLEVDATGGWNLSNANISNTVSYTFFGTGLILRMRGDGSMNNTVTFNGLTANTTNFPGIVSSGWGSVSALNTSTGVFTGSGLTQGSGISISGLPLGLYTMKLTKNNANDIRFNRTEVITPIHVPNADSNLLRDDLIGSNSLKSEVTLPDFRKEKAFFPAGVDLGEGSTKWQIKYLLSDQAGQNDVPELRFTGLKVGRTYRINMNPYFQAAVAINHMSAYNGGTRVSYWYMDASSTVFMNSKTDIFTAADSVLTIDTSTTNIRGNGTRDFTHVILEELPNHKETNEW